MPTYKLHYFDLRARGELARMVLNTAGQDFEDIRISFEEWPKVKSSFPTGQLPLLEIDDLKLSQSMAIARYLAREYAMPTGQMPVLEFDGQKLSQSMAIARYLARKFGFAGKTNLEQALVDQVVDTVGDLFTEFVKCRFEKDEAKKLTLADMAVYEVLETLQKKEAKCLDKFPKLVANRKSVAQQPRLDNYLKTRPESDI
ncbi:hypothetical protein KUTeg_020295 [Tegillarca granosa]|uniref:Glutathione transferase n=1 Tax=Tegillarca granosa TaxID=220873 RepID=A0ABQ9E7F6_TEGGR|nr:hypothetical protein KUTeg_020295 [Tegillarca granosa]